MPTLPKDSFSERVYHEEHDPRYLIVKGNPLVQDTHYDMSLEDTKVLSCLISSIKPDQQSLSVKFSTERFMRMLGIKRDKNNFDYIMAAIRSVSRDNFWVKTPDGKYKLWQWLKDATADPHGAHRGDFIVTFRPELKKYLFSKSMKYRTIYKFSDIMLMQSKYSPRLFEIFRSNQSRQKIQKRGLNYSIAELKYSLDLMHHYHKTGKIKHDKHGKIKFKYPRFADFKRYVITPAIKEINELTDYNIKITPIKPSRKVIGFNVVLLEKNKKQIRQRDDRIFFITHHIPKSEWKTWREDTIRGKFHRVKPRNRKPKKIHAKVVSSSGSTSHIKDDTPSKAELKHLDDYLGKHKVPFKEVNMSGDKIEYYSPMFHKYMWTTYYMRTRQMKLYYAQKKMVKQLEEAKPKSHRKRV